MMATVASINTSFTATTGALEKGVKRAENLVGGFGKRVRSSFFALPQASQLIHGTLAALGISAFVGKIKSQLDDLGQTFDRSISLGIAPQNLKALEFAGSLAGVSADDLSTALAKMQRNISEAAEGTKTQVEAFKKLGLSAKEIKSLAPDEQLGKISDALFKIKSPTDRINAAMDIFGKSGARLLSFLSEGSDGIKRAAEDYARLGGLISEIDFAAADVAGDALLRMQTAFGNIKQSLVVGATPSITLFTEALAQVAGAAALATRAHRGWYLELNKTVGDLLVHPHNPLQKNTGPVKASDILEEDWKRILRQMDETMRRAQELRGMKIGDEAEAAAKGKQVEPAAVEFGTAKAIEAINKASGASETKNIQKQILAVNKDQEKVLNQINRKLDNKEIMEPAGIND